MSKLDYPRNSPALFRKPEAEHVTHAQAIVTHEPAHVTHESSRHAHPEQRDAQSDAQPRTGAQRSKAYRERNAEAVKAANRERMRKKRATKQSQ